MKPQPKVALAVIVESRRTSQAPAEGHIISKIRLHVPMAAESVGAACLAQFKGSCPVRQLSLMKRYRTQPVCYPCPFQRACSRRERTSSAASPRQTRYSKDHTHPGEAAALIRGFHFQGLLGHCSPQTPLSLAPFQGTWLRLSN